MDKVGSFLMVRLTVGGCFWEALSVKVVLSDFVDETGGDCSTELSEKVSPSLLLVSAFSFWLLSIDELVENS